MENLLADLKLLSYIIIPIVALVAWSIRLEQLVKNNGSISRKNNEHIMTLFTRIDDFHARVQVIEAKIVMHDALMSPEKQKDFWIGQAHMIKDLEYLKRDIGKCLSG